MIIGAFYYDKDEIGLVYIDRLTQGHVFYVNDATTLKLELVSEDLENGTWYEFEAEPAFDPEFHFDVTIKKMEYEE